METPAAAARRRLRVKGDIPPNQLLKTPGQTLEQKLSRWSEDRNGHTIWIAKAKGLPQLGWGGRNVQVRRLVYEQAHGPIAPGHTIANVCCVHNCIALKCLKPFLKGHSPAYQKSLRSATFKLHSRHKPSLKIAAELTQLTPQVKAKVPRNSLLINDYNDCVQEALLAVWQNAVRRFKQDPIKSLEAVFILALRNKIINFLRSPDRDRLVSCPPEDLIRFQDPSTPEDLYASALSAYRARKRIYAAMRKTTKARREVLYLWAKGLSGKAIAAELGLSPNTIEVHLARGKKDIATRKATPLKNAL